ncbi:peptide MFS transporter [Allokutzneria albata]|uniref:Proton-dependent oligopeptide transporter, POT family n=1 Tax=Allokutzneria albata TaxID=211114 RepID=A0A1G9VCZ5_ALLAB|nr:peptide MFS transporter [Allokutzneria albata]SDM70049.1 proton-dependent oligopeptide transporter, POT family [Allokutzneria albata]
MTATESTKPAQQRGFFGHPWGLATLFFTEMWERFSYYGMRVLLVLFLPAAVVDGGLGMDKGLASSLVSAYGAAIYMSALAGGWIADRLLGGQRSVFYGGVLIMAGHISMAVPAGSATIFLGLALIILGTSLLKPNISTLVGGLYAEHDARRDAGFTVFYMGVNLGSFVGITVSGWLGEKVDFHLGFGAAAVGMALGLVQYVLGRRNLGAATAAPVNPLTAAERGKVLGRIGAGLAAVALVVVVLSALGWMSVQLVIDGISVLSILLPVAYFAVLLRSPLVDDDERSRVKGYIPLFLASVMFFMIFEQAANVLNLYAVDKVDRTIFGLEFPATWFQSVNPVFILLFAPVVATIWMRMGERQPTTPRKFAIALVLIGSSFGLLVLADLTKIGGLVSPLWLLAVYAVQTLGELLLSPIGLSVTTKAAPKAFVSQMMALWFLSIAAGNGIAAQLVPLYGNIPEGLYFGMFAGAAVLLAVLLWMSAPKIRELMRGAE